MARVWHHIDPTTGLWAEWAAGTLPSWQSLFRFEFLNQFIGWMRYAGNFSYNGDYHIPAYLGPSTIPYFLSLVPGRSSEKFLLPGDDLQDAALWNSILHFDATNAVEFDDSAWIKTDYDAILTPGSELDPDDDWADLSGDEDYVAAAVPESELTAGDIIQWSRDGGCELRVAVKNARARLDMCNAVAIDKFSSFDSFTFKTTKIPEWSSSETYYYPFSDWAEVNALGRIYLRCNRYYADGWWWTWTEHVSDAVVRATRSAYSQIAQNISYATSPVKNTLSVAYDLWPSDGASLVVQKIISVEKSGTENSGQIGYFMPPAPLVNMDESGSVLLHGNVAVVLDEDLPVDFKPEDGFPWET